LALELVLGLEAAMVLGLGQVLGEAMEKELVLELGVEKEQEWE
jgi:hypothetical protein